MSIGNSPNVGKYSLNGLIAEPTSDADHAFNSNILRTWGARLVGEYVDYVPQIDDAAPLFPGSMYQTIYNLQPMSNTFLPPFSTDQSTSLSVLKFCRYAIHGDMCHFVGSIRRQSPGTIVYGQGPRVKLPFVPSKISATGPGGSIATVAGVFARGVSDNWAVGAAIIWNNILDGGITTKAEGYMGGLWTDARAFYQTSTGTALTLTTHPAISPWGSAGGGLHLSWDILYEIDRNYK